MSTLVDRLFQLWTHPSDDRRVLEREIRSIYTDPVVLNGHRTPLSVLIDRAETMAGAFSEQSTELLEVVHAEDHLAFAFVRRGRHTGVFESSLGPIEPSGREFEFRGVDIFTVVEGKIAGGSAIFDEIGLLRLLGALPR